jgi:methionyl-tRNA formyltransferase
MALRVAFFGTPAFAVPTLEQVQASSHHVVVVVTQPDRPRGRGQKLTPGPVKARAVELDLPVLQPTRLRSDEFLRPLADARADIGVVAAYGRILPQAVLEMPRLGMINVHASLLPRWRGAAPIHRAVLAGDRETGITIMRVVQALDAGDALARVVIPIGANETSAELEQRLAAAGAPLLVDTLDRLASGPIAGTPQDESLVTYAHRLERHESRIDWTRAAGVVHNQIRGLQPWPLAAALLDGRRVLILRSEVASDQPGGDAGRHASPAGERTPGTIVGVEPDGLLVQTGAGCVRILRLQPEGRPAMSVRDFLNGRRVAVGDRFTPLPPEP